MEDEVFYFKPRLPYGRRGLVTKGERGEVVAGLWGGCGSARLGSARLGSALRKTTSSGSDLAFRGRKNPTSPPLRKTRSEKSDLTSIRKTRSCRRGRITEGEVVARSCPEMLFPVWSCHTMSPYRRNPRQHRGVINYFVLRCVSSWQPHAHVLPQILLVQL